MERYVRSKKARPMGDYQRLPKYICHKCGQGFNKSSTITAHLKKKHKTTK